MGAIHLASDIPAEGAADERVGQEMFLPANARGGNRTGHPVCEELSCRPGIFVRNHARDSPTHRCVLRGKRSCTLKKTTASIAGERTFASEGVLESRRVENCIDRRFSAQQASFAR